MTIRAEIYAGVIDGVVTYQLVREKRVQNQVAILDPNQTGAVESLLDDLKRREIKPGQLRFMDGRLIDERGRIMGVGKVGDEVYADVLRRLTPPKP